jgi:hypothetical protein
VLEQFIPEGVECSREHFIAVVREAVRLATEACNAEDYYTGGHGRTIEQHLEPLVKASGIPMSYLVTEAGGMA